jgi:hypothetical protein
VTRDSFPRYDLAPDEVQLPSHCPFCGGKLNAYECHNAECFGRFVPGAAMEALAPDEGEGEEEYEQRLALALGVRE